MYRRRSPLLFKFLVILIALGSVIHLLTWKISQRKVSGYQTMNMMVKDQFDGLDEEHGHLDYQRVDEYEQKKSHKVIKEEDVGKESEDTRYYFPEEAKSGTNGESNFEEKEEEIIESKEIFEDEETQPEEPPRLSNFFYGQRSRKDEGAEYSYKVSYVSYYDDEVPECEDSFCDILLPQFRFLREEGLMNDEKMVKRELLILIDSGKINKDQFIEKYDSLKSKFTDTGLLNDIFLFYLDEQDDFHGHLSLSKFIIRVGFQNEILPRDYERCILKKTNMINEMYGELDKYVLVMSSSNGMVLSPFERSYEKISRKLYLSMEWNLPRTGLTVMNSRFSMKKFHSLYVSHAELVNIIRSESIDSSDEFLFKSVDLNCDSPFVVVRSDHHDEKAKKRGFWDKKENDEVTFFLRQLDGEYGTNVSEARSAYFKCIDDLEIGNGEINL